MNNIDSKSSTSPHSQQEMESVNHPKQFSLKLQILLYSLITKDIELNPGKYKRLSKLKQQ